MADGSHEDRTGPKQMNDLTFSGPDKEHGDTKKCSGETFDSGRLKLSFYRELETSESCEKSDTRGVAAIRAAVGTKDSQKSADARSEDGDDRKKRCLDRYDSSESSDSGVAVLSPTESGDCSGSDITEPRSPRSPESSCCTTEEGAVGARMPPWASDPAPPALRRIAVQPAPVRRSQPPIHRRITEYFNHKMKPQNGLKREAHIMSNDDTKRKCLPKNGATNDLEKYISYLSQTLSPKVLMDEGKPDVVARKPPISFPNVNIESKKIVDLNKITPNTVVNGVTDLKNNPNAKNHTAINGFVHVSYNEKFSKEKLSGGLQNSRVDSKKRNSNSKTSADPSADRIKRAKKQKSLIGSTNKNIQLPSRELIGLKIVPAPSECNYGPLKNMGFKVDASTTTKMDSRMNGVTCGSNNLSLMTMAPKIITPTKKDIQRKSSQTKRNRKSSACIANGKSLTWSKVNNQKRELQKQKCINPVQTNVPINNMPGEGNTAPKMNIPNGMRQVSMTVNGSLGNLNVPATNFQNCHQINLSQPCNGTVTSSNLPSFVAVPHNVMLTTLRIPQNGLPAQALGQQNNMTFNRPNVNVSSPTKLNGQFVFPLVQNINGTVVQIPNLVAKMPNFVLPQTQQLAPQRQDHLQNPQSAQILINGTLLKLANTMTPAYPHVNKPSPVTSQSIPMMNKNVTGMPTVGMTVQTKPNYTVNLSHPVLVPQPGFFVTSVPNINVKETWSYNTAHSVHSSQTSCSNPIIHHPPPIISNFTTQALHSSSIPIAPVKPPDNPIQGTDPPSSTVKEPELCEMTSQKCDIPWLSKTVNNNIFLFDSNLNKMTTRPFAQVSSLADQNIDLLIGEKTKESPMVEEKQEKIESSVELRKVEEVARREETIFTQITVLKDVSSNVHSSVLEANFCNSTTESESGIGTDKSIDSPSDSQASKECDEDSSLSLSVSVCSVDVPSQKSPILKQPKTLRFPPMSQTKSTSSKRTSSTDTVTVCLWEGCKKEFESDPDLLEHLQSVHVESQAGKENYVCLWQQCKVRGKPSCSRLWLERHALSHGGNKPFRCIVDGCDRRFSTQILLERHVNNHFNETSPSNGSKKSTDSASKLIRRNGKKLRYRRQPWSARMFDFFDAGMMEGLAWRLARSTRWRLGGGCPLREPAGRHTLTLHTKLTATRHNAASGVREALVTYYPPHVLDDEWVPVSDVQRIKRVEISDLPVHTKVLLFEQFSESYKSTAPKALNNLLKEDDLPLVSKNTPDVNAACNEEKEVSGAKKRKLGRRYGGNSFWPCGR